MSSLDERLQAMVAGAEPTPVRVARDPVNRPQIHHWCDAIGDANVAYADEALAARTVHGGIVAPPTMLQAWIMPGLAGRGPSLPEDLRAPELAASRGDHPITALQEAGYTSVVATDCEQDYFRYLRPGDEIRSFSVLESVIGEKKTALGRGYFVTELITFLDDDDRKVGEMRFRTLWFKPAAAPPTEADGEGA